MARRARLLKTHPLFRTEALALRGIADDFDGRLSRILEVIRQFPEQAVVDPEHGWSTYFGEQIGFPATIFYRFDELAVEAMSIRQFGANLRRRF